MGRTGPGSSPVYKNKIHLSYEYRVLYKTVQPRYNTDPLTFVPLRDHERDWDLIGIWLTFKEKSERA